MMSLSKFRRVLLFIVIIFFLSVPSGFAQSDELQRSKAISVIGTADVYRESISAAREQAIANSLVSAVKSVVADLLPIDALITHFPTLNMVFFEQTRKFIQNYRVLTEYKLKRKYRVLVQVNVLEDKVTEQLSSVGIMFEKQALPGILLFITEQNPEASWPQYWWGKENSAYISTTAERVLTDTLGEKGFAVIDHSFVDMPSDIDAITYKSHLNNKEAATVGSKLNAEVVLIGSSVARSTLNTMGEDMKAFKGTVSVRAVKADTGEEIASTTQSAVATHTDLTSGGMEAIGAAGKLAAAEIAAKITNAWKREKTGPEMIAVTLSGTQQLSAFVKLRMAMSSTHGVNRIQIKEIKINEATMEVDFQGETEDLAAALMLNDFETFGINISELDQGHFNVEIVPAGSN